MNPYYLPGYASPSPTPSGNLNTSLEGTVTPWTSNDFTDDVKDTDWGDYVKGGIGALGMGAQLYSMSRQKLGLTGREVPSTSGYSGDYLNTALNAHPQRLNGGEVLGGAAKGAATGFSVGGPIGGAIGAGAGALGTIFASNMRRRHQEHERDQALAQALSYQSNYNSARNTRDQQDVTAADYQRRLDNYNQNLFSWTAI